MDMECSVHGAKKLDNIGNEKQIPEADAAKEPKTMKERLESAEKILIGLGEEWADDGKKDLKAAYEALSLLLKGKDYFIVTMNTDGLILDSGLERDRIVAPCGNKNWFQCEHACTKDIWEAGEIADGKCPHCGAPLISNTIEAETYIEEGYLPQWNAYTKWLAGTLNRHLLVMELGVGFKLPNVIRWPFEKTAFFNKKAYMYRVNGTLYQISEELKEKAEGICEDSVEFVVQFHRM